MPPRKGCCRAAKAGIFVDQGQLLLMPTKCELRKVASAGNCEGQEGRIGGGTHSDVVEMTAMGSTFRLTATGFRIVGDSGIAIFSFGHRRIVNDSDFAIFSFIQIRLFVFAPVVSDSGIGRKWYSMYLGSEKRGE